MAHPVPRSSKKGTAMKYISTRGGVPPRNFCDILLGGLAPDGGLYLPEHYPQVTKAELAEWRDLPYRELALRIIEKFVDDIPACDLKDLTDRTYTAHTYRHCRPGRDAEDITPLTTLEPDLHLLELSNGPTLAFKDMAMQLLGNLFEYVLEKRGESLNVLGATSGDTGSSAEYAMLGKQNVKVFMLSPEGRMSPFQRAQMYSLRDGNIFNIAVRGMFDDAQDVVKAVSNDAAFKAQYRIGAVNSINWARVLAQVVYYFKGWFAATAGNDEQVAFCVPSGNFGNICAGHIARMMGLPIARLVLATNENDVLHEFFRSGIYRPRPTAETHVTSSPSMDISRASNFERFMFDAVGRDSGIIRNGWGALDEKVLDMLYFPGSPNVLRTQFGFVSGYSTHADRLATILDVWERYGTMIDPHTADGVKVAREHREPGVPMVVMETAQPVKFPDTIREALGRDPLRPKDFEGIEDLPQRVEVMDPDPEAVKRFIANNV